MYKFYLAQVNVAKRLAPMDDPIMQDFINNVDRINTIADEAEGFVWRMKDEDKDLGAKIFQDETLLINMSVWTDIDALFNYTYKTGHLEVFKRKKEWFSKVQMKHMAFWYVPVGYQPNFYDAKERLDYLNTNGDTPYSFTFKKRFSVEDFLTYKKLA
ncbi:DUF3291 domain-containing protein [Seonamhaeicola sp. MEBiC1930]|uniref:DUF3291 domain-containing protein n=1 Tax=Seonamhaeicola sp. MEBiC01930 TaxID=2976768 RepID=UPI003244A05D